MPTLKQAQTDPKAMKQFIADHESEEAPQEPLKRYIDASAMPLENRKASQSVLSKARSGDCK